MWSGRAIQGNILSKQSLSVLIFIVFQAVLLAFSAVREITDPPHKSRSPYWAQLPPIAWRRPKTTRIGWRFGKVWKTLPTFANRKQGRTRYQCSSFFEGPTSSAPL